MTKPEGYCKGCRDRTAEDPESGTRDCHIDCEKYKQYKRELAEWSAKYYREKDAAELSQRRPWLGKYVKGIKHND